MSDEALCPACGLDMMTADSCTNDEPIVLVDGQAYAFVRYGDEPLWEELGADPTGSRCRDCCVAVGGNHHPGCVVERCPRCGGQMFGCPCCELWSPRPGYRPRSWPTSGGS